MCEPCHSIIQFPLSTEEGTNFNFESRFGISVIDRLKRIFGKYFSRGRVVNEHGFDYFHISQFGYGHSQVLRKVIKQKPETALRAQSIDIISDLPMHYQYEVDWWNTPLFPDYAIRLDPMVMRRACLPAIRPEHRSSAVAAASHYNIASCTGNVKQFRRFLEESMIATRGFLFDYSGSFGCMLIPSESHKLHKTLDRIRKDYGVDNEDSVRMPYVRAVMGYTRRRKAWKPFWADNDTFWGDTTSATHVSGRLAT